MNVDTHGRFQNFTDTITYKLFDNYLINTKYGSATAFSGVLLIVISIFAIKLGSYASIEKPTNALPPNEQHPLYDPSDKDIYLTPKEEQISMTMAISLPIFAAISLLSMYKFMNSNVTYLNSFIQCCIIFLSFSSTSYTISFLYNSICRNIVHSHGKAYEGLNKRYTLSIAIDKKGHPTGFEQELINLPESTIREKIIKEETLLEIRDDIKKEDQLTNFYFSTGTVYGYVFGLLFAFFYFYLNGNQNWLLNNFLGFSSVVVTISKVKIPSFPIATLLLSLFFFYDIYFVFATDVMVSVATKIDAPAKLMMPIRVSNEMRTISSSILGLGDLALPGIFIALCLRFDLFLFHEKNKNHEFHHLQPFEKKYFEAAIVGYVFGLMLTFIIVQIFNTGQPALLYLVPSTLLSVYVTAWMNDEFKTLWKYSETEEEIKAEPETELPCSSGTLFLAGLIKSQGEDSDEENDPDWLSEKDDLDDDYLENSDYIIDE